MLNDTLDDKVTRKLVVLGPAMATANNDCQSLCTHYNSGVAMQQSESCCTCSA
jgi:hypothetical protein